MFLVFMSAKNSKMAGKIRPALIQFKHIKCNMQFSTMQFSHASR